MKTMNKWQKAKHESPDTSEIIEMITDYGFTVLIGKFVDGVYYEYAGLEPWTMHDLTKIETEVLLWKYFELPDRNMLK